MQVYYFTSAQYALSNIEKRRLKVAELATVNDPFEWAAPAFHRRDDRNAMRETRREMGRRWGLLCFSANWRNPVQWGHYADRHRGVCLGFEVPAEYLIKVEYMEEREEIESLEQMHAAGTLNEDWIKAMICTKFSHWSYEAEQRVFVELDETSREDGLHFKGFDANLRLNQVIVGAESSVTRAQVAAALGSFRDEVACKKARLAFKTFEVCEQQNAKVWT